MHYPERWGYLQFTKNSTTDFKLPYSEKQKEVLWQIYYSQKQYLFKNGRYAANLSDFDQTPTIQIDGKSNSLTMEATTNQFKASIMVDEKNISINDEGLIQYPKKP